MVKRVSSDSSNLIPYTSFQNSCPDAARLVLTSLDYPDFLRFINISKNTQLFSESENNSVERSLFSRIQIFDRAHFEKYWGAIITDQFDPCKIDIFVLREFLKTYYGPNPIGKGRVKEVCLLPAVVPISVKIADIESIYCLNRLEQLAEQPKEGYAAKYINPSPGLLEQHGETGEEQARLVILLRTIVAGNKYWSRNFQDPAERGQIQFLQDLNVETGYGCEIEPDALSQNTVLFAHHAVTGERGFAADHRGQPIYGRTREVVGRIFDSRMVSGCFHDKTAFTGCSIDMLSVSYSSGHDEDDGVGVLRKVPNSCISSTEQRPTSNRSPLKRKCKVLRSYKL